MSELQCLLIVAFATALLLHTAHCSGRPKISHVSTDQIQDLGSSVDLECTLENSQHYPILWIRTKLGEAQEENLPISSNYALITRDKRYSVRFNESTLTYTLRIDDIRETDAGFYGCRILISVSSQVKADVELKVRRPPIISDNSTNSLMVREGQSVKLECYAEGYPEPEISWRRENNTKLPNGNFVFYGNVLRIDAAQKEYRGTYYCMAKNVVGDCSGSEAQHNVTLEIQFAPVIEAKRTQIGQALLYDADMECHVIAFPSPIIYWHQNEEMIVTSKHFNVTDFKTVDGYGSTLRVSNIKKEHFGDYSCRAENYIGIADAKFHLFETETPVYPLASGQVSNTIQLNQENEA